MFVFIFICSINEFEEPETSEDGNISVIAKVCIVYVCTIRTYMHMYTYIPLKLTVCLCHIFSDSWCVSNTV